MALGSLRFVILGCADVPVAVPALAREVIEMRDPAPIHGYRVWPVPWRVICRCGLAARMRQAPRGRDPGRWGSRRRGNLRSDGAR